MPVLEGLIRPHSAWGKARDLAYMAAAAKGGRLSSNTLTPRHFALTQGDTLHGSYVSQ